MGNNPSSRGASQGSAAVLALFCADLIVRTSYQIGKAPVLTVLAMNLNTAPLLLGTIASISTATGFLLKPIFGILSDRQGRWIWLLIGTCLFAGVPVLYCLVASPSDLVALRLLHGLATAIYGPITLAWIAAANCSGTAEAFGWFGLARTGASVGGPLIGGAALTMAQPETIYTLTSFLATLAFLGVLRLRGSQKKPLEVSPSTLAISTQLNVLVANRSIFLIGLIEGTVHVSIYAVKGFAPVLLLMSGSNPMTVGMFLALQEAIAAIARPAMGRLADRTNPSLPMVLGMLLISSGLMSVAGIGHGAPMFVAAALIGGGQGAFGPAALSCVARTVPNAQLGLAYGAVGALRNGGKILGPIAAGGLTAFSDASVAFLILASVPLIAIVPMLYGEFNGGRKVNSLSNKVRNG